MSKKDAPLAAALEAKRLVGESLVDAATRAFFANLGSARCPSSQTLDAALVAARLRLLDSLFDRHVLSTLAGHGRSGGATERFERERRDLDRLDAVRLGFARLAPELRCPPLPAVSELHPARLALAALLGALLGVLLGGPVGMYLLDARDTGLLFGAPLGAFLFTWAIEQASRNRIVSNLLIGALGVATAAEAWAFFSLNPLAAVWRRLSGRSALGRISVYLALVALLLFTRRQASYDRATFERSVRLAIEQWVHAALIALAVLMETTTDEEQDGADDKRFAELGRRIVELFSAPAERLSDAADDVIAAARDAGFAGLDGAALFRRPTTDDDPRPMPWDETMREQYDVYGHVEIGDLVRIEQQPVIFRGEVREKGLVRKHRGR